jgi:acyl-[acyl-carrier-protein]-phospholipid O-acyltransferase/long-chain-fatty-acid--[acyl-carrier-protein] ligase
MHVILDPSDWPLCLKADVPGILQPPPDGWYGTGDIVAIDHAGFVTIKGRA